MSDVGQQNSITLQIGEIEEILRNIPHHKGTDHYIGKMRARLAHLRDREIESEIKSKGGGGGGYAVKKTGDASVTLIGPPSCGKSTLINKLTNAESKVAEYSFTTLSVIPGMLLYNDAYIQIFDVPGIIEGAGEGRGRGKEVLSVARNSDLLVIMSDVKRKGAYTNILSELHKVGIRINDTKPNVLIEKKTEGGLSIKTNLHQSLDKETIKDIILEMGTKNAEVTLKENVSIDRLIDAFPPYLF
jgi:small GTP-binding protein